MNSTVTRRTSNYTVQVSPLNASHVTLMNLVGRLGNNAAAAGHAVQGSWISVLEGHASVAVRLSDDAAALAFAEQITAAEHAVTVRVHTGLGIHAREVTE